MASSWTDFCAQAASGNSWGQFKLNFDKASFGTWPAWLLRLAESLYALQCGDWQTAHRIVQEDGTKMGAWLHAHLHKVEGDAANSRYWYNRSDGHYYEDYRTSDEPEVIWLALQDAAGRNTP